MNEANQTTNSSYVIQLAREMTGFLKLAVWWFDVSKQHWGYCTGLWLVAWLLKYLLQYVLYLLCYMLSMKKFWSTSEHCSENCTKIRTHVSAQQVLNYCTVVCFARLNCIWMSHGVPPGLKEYSSTQSSRSTTSWSLFHRTEPFEPSTVLYWLHQEYVLQT